jgi:hypothetical protein
MDRRPEEGCRFSLCCSRAIARGNITGVDFVIDGGLISTL